MAQFFFLLAHWANPTFHQIMAILLGEGNQMSISLNGTESTVPTTAPLDRLLSPCPGYTCCMTDCIAENIVVYGNNILMLT